MRRSGQATRTSARRPTIRRRPSRPPDDPAAARRSRPRPLVATRWSVGVAVDGRVAVGGRPRPWRVASVAPWRASGGLGRRLCRAWRSASLSAWPSASAWRVAGSARPSASVSAWPSASVWVRGRLRRRRRRRGGRRRRRWRRWRSGDDDPRWIDLGVIAVGPAAAPRAEDVAPRSDRELARPREHDAAGPVRSRRSEVGPGAADADADPRRCLPVVSETVTANVKVVVGVPVPGETVPPRW